MSRSRTHEITSHTALVIDDDPVVCMITSHFLRQLGIETIVSGSVPDAFKVTAQKAPDVILLDLFLKDQLSESLIPILREKFSPVPPPIVIITAEENPAALLNEQSAPSSILMKPFSLSELESCLISLGIITK